MKNYKRQVVKQLEEQTEKAEREEHENRELYTENKQLRDNNDRLSRRLDALEESLATRWRPPPWRPYGKAAETPVIVMQYPFLQ
jgi:predicted RNase H-like nuclease (RuvC/YqgF family)